MPGIHKNGTIAFRPSEWQKHLIDERAALSGMFKKDFITRSCLFDSIIVTGTKENIDRIIASVQEMEAVLIEITGMLVEHSGDFPLESETIKDIRADFLATVITIVEILDGASYLFHKKVPERAKDWKVSLEEEQFRHILQMDAEKENGAKGVVEKDT